MLRRYRSFKKLVYAGAILFTTIILYATTSDNEYALERDEAWKLPIKDDGTQRRVDVALLEPLQRPPLGPFADPDLPVVVEALRMQIPEFNESKSGMDPTNVQSKEAAPAPVVPPPPPAAPTPAPAPAAPTPAPAAPTPAPVSPAAMPATPAPPAIPPSPPAPQPSAIPPAPAVQPVTPAPLAPAPSPSPAPVAVQIAAPSVTPPTAAQPIAIAAPPLVVVAPTPAPAAPAPPPAPAAAAPSPAPAAPSKALPDLAKVTQEMATRISQTKEQCDRLKTPHVVDSDVYLLTNHNITYCKVPRSGSTYWEQVFSYLNHNPRELAYLGYKSPFQISRYHIRYTSYFNLPRRQWKKEEHKTEIDKTLRIVFVRHPLERLWSSYIQNFFLIDFWTSVAQQVKSKNTEDGCPKLITWREFIDFSISVFNENWAPATELCNPCTYQPQVIGHVETFRDDTFYTLKQAKLDWIFLEQDKLSLEETRMLDIVEYSYQKHSIHWYSFYHRCFSQKELAIRLWEAFKKLGYFSSHAGMPDNLPDYNQTTVVRELKTQIKKFGMSGTNRRAQQLKTMQKDFAGLPKPVMTRLFEKYSMDFQLFGYKPEVPT